MNDSFGQYLKDLRNSKSMSMADVFKETGITNSRLSKLENNQTTDPTISAICKLAKCYEVSVIDMLYEAGMDIDRVVPLKHTSFLKQDEIEALQQLVDLFTKGRWNDGV